MSGRFAREKGSEFGGGHRPVLSRVKAGQGQGTEGGSHQLQHKVVQGFKKTTDLSVSAFGQGDPVPGVGVRIPFRNEFHGNNRSPVKADIPPGDAFEMGRRDSPLDLDQISPRNRIARMKDPLGEIAVVGQEQGPLGLEVEAAHMEQGLDIGKEFPKSRPAFRVVKGRDNPLRLVEKKEKGLGFPPEGFAFDQNSVGLGVDPGSRLGHDLSVDRHQS